MATTPANSKFQIPSSQQGCRFNVNTLASGQTRGFVLNTWPKTGVHTPSTPALNVVFTQCAHSVHAVKPFETKRRGEACSAGRS